MTKLEKYVQEMAKTRQITTEIQRLEKSLNEIISRAQKEAGLEHHNREPGCPCWTTKKLTGYYYNTPEEALEDELKVDKATEHKIKWFKCVEEIEKHRLLPNRPYKEAVDLGILQDWWRDAFVAMYFQFLNKEHKYLTQEDCRCGNDTCNVCVGGLAVCDVCKLYEGCLTTECPGVISCALSDQIYKGDLDFRYGGWVNKCSKHMAHKYPDKV